MKVFEPITLSEAELRQAQEALATPAVLKYFKSLVHADAQDLLTHVPKEGTSLEEYYRKESFIKGKMMAITQIHDASDAFLQELTKLRNQGTTQ